MNKFGKLYKTMLQISSVPATHIKCVSDISRQNFWISFGGRNRCLSRLAYFYAEEKIFQLLIGNMQ